MAKRIKLTEAQVEMLQKLEASSPKRVMKITEAQLNRIFNENKNSKGHPIVGDADDNYTPQTEKENKDTTDLFNESVSEDIDDTIFKGNFKQSFKDLLKGIIENPETPTVPTFFVEKGFTWEVLKPNMIKFFNKNGQKLKPTNEFIEAAKTELPKIKELVKNGPPVAQEESTMSLGNDIEIVPETTTTGSVGGSYVTPKIWADGPENMKFGKTPMYKGGQVVKDNLTELDTEEAPKAPKKVKVPEVPTAPKKRYVGELDMHIDGVDEEEAIKIGDEIAKLINKKFNLSARVKNLVAVKYGGKLKEDFDRKGQVEFDDCVKLNNNTEAQDGGCSVGAVDNVVKIKEDLYLEVARRTGRELSEVKSILNKNFNK